MINNRSDFEVVVYAMPSPYGRGARIGTARALGTTSLLVPSSALQGTDALMVQLHAIGSSRLSRNWTSAAIYLDAYSTAQLDIMGDLSGNLKFSTLSTRRTALGERIRR